MCKALWQGRRGVTTQAFCPQFCKTKLLDLSLGCSLSQKYFAMQNIFESPKKMFSREALAAKQKKPHKATFCVLAGETRRRLEPYKTLKICKKD